MKAAAPVISLLLLILISAAAVAIISYTLTDIVNKNTSRAQTELEKGKDRLIIQTVGPWDPNTDSIKAYVYNDGDREANIVGAYVLDAQGSVMCAPDNIETINPMVIGAGATSAVTIDFDASCVLPKGAYVLKIVTETGSSTTYNFEVI